jgi:multiple sugar transport system permease protein
MLLIVHSPMLKHYVDLLTRLRSPGAAMVSFAIAAPCLVPHPLLFVPLADRINRLGLNDTPTSVIPT